MYFDRKVYDVALKYYHGLINKDQALALCSGKEEQLFSALQKIGDASNLMRNYYIVKHNKNISYAAVSLYSNLSNLFKQIYDNIIAGDRAGINLTEARGINEIFKNKMLNDYMYASKLWEKIKAAGNSQAVINFIHNLPKASEVTPSEVPTADKCIDLYYEYINAGKMEQAHAIYQIITYGRNF